MRFAFFLGLLTLPALAVLSSIATLYPAKYIMYDDPNVYFAATSKSHLPIIVIDRDVYEPVANKSSAYTHSRLIPGYDMYTIDSPCQGCPTGFMTDALKTAEFLVAYDVEAWKPKWNISMKNYNISTIFASKDGSMVATVIFQEIRGKPFVMSIRDGKSGVEITQFPLSNCKYNDDPYASCETFVGEIMEGKYISVYQDETRPTVYDFHGKIVVPHFSLRGQAHYPYVTYFDNTDRPTDYGDIRTNTTHKISPFADKDQVVNFGKMEINSTQNTFFTVTRTSDFKHFQAQIYDIARQLDIYLYLLELHLYLSIDLFSVCVVGV